ncbi:carbon-nitrogen hydrolase [Tothia fuscella]|uniref:Carbon-nitrogen hydrolase n=1 Tax=Tothia fuscella TaxID=1048955 RepID=A0A9P4P099_9PEZI|nr:carbon-nitrogen hydrolase [Tothia fuscella]
MRIACLQFAPQLGKIQQNMERANRLIENSAELHTASDGRPLWLNLPEMSFTGYNFQSLEEITPFLEPTCEGPSTIWAKGTARRYGIFVTVGYPETVPHLSPQPLDIEQPPQNYNSTVTVSPSGQIVATYRKRFLYYTDETWALEGDGKTSPSGFFAGALGPLGNVSMGICMDINPYKFLSDWSSYEFASHVLQARTPLVVVNMAWLTRLTPQELTELPLRPDEETFTYWIGRFQPLLEANVRMGEDVGPIVVVCANRCGIEGSACYAGTSSVFMVEDGKVSIFDVLGKLEEKCMVIDLNRPAKFELERRAT